ncbi:hypothetical protein P879_01155 [Paragonimus westermani]|uniref:Uncharacterized protein n=1 Tax=Paragonimus westermani TaxID=34504 RepID=A0A8T0DSW9_9TREM|nr:hypothetical protein P879_01155 [Paragonimus westermani]
MERNSSSTFIFVNVKLRCGNADTIVAHFQFQKKQAISEVETMTNLEITAMLSTRMTITKWQFVLKQLQAASTSTALLRFVCLQKRSRSKNQVHTPFTSQNYLLTSLKFDLIFSPYLITFIHAFFSISALISLFWCECHQIN